MAQCPLIISDPARDAVNSNESNFGRITAIRKLQRRKGEKEQRRESGPLFPSPPFLNVQTF